MNKQPFALLIASILFALIFGSLTTIQAEAETEPHTAATPEFINIQDGNNIQLQGVMSYYTISQTNLDISLQQIVQYYF